MNMLILSLIILQGLSTSFCYEIEMDGLLRLGKEVLNVVSSPKKLAEILFDFIPTNMQGKGKLPEAFQPTEVPRSKDSNIIQEKDNINKKTDPLEQFVDHLLKKGRKTLKNLGKQIITDLYIKWNITPILEIVTNDYIEKMQNYYEFVEKPQNGPGKDSVYLDMVETSCKLLLHDEKKLLNDIIMHESHNTHDSSYRQIIRKLFKRSKKDKIEAMKYICETYNVCREYPAFTDKIADLISEVLELDDKKFTTVLVTLNKVVKHSENIVIRIADKQDRELIMAKLREFPIDLMTTRERFTLTKAVITDRFKTISSDSEEFKIRTKAARIIMDIIDKAFTADHDVLDIDMRLTTKAIREWSIDRRTKIDKNLEDFGKSMIRRLGHQLTKNARKELKVLIQTLMRGNTSDNEVYQRLIKYGSKYVKGDDFHSDVDIMLNT